MNIRKTIRSILNSFRPSVTEFEGRTLPAPYLRLCGDYFRNDRFFIESARSEAIRLVQHFKLTRNSVILDLGCGYGRLAFGLLEVLPNINKYIGIDVNREAIDWCSKYIAAKSPNFGFIHTNVENDRYNPDGVITSESLRLPIEDQSIDVIYLFSVFSHMFINDILAYLVDFRRILGYEGSVFFTAFVEEKVDDMVENPKGYLRKSWNGPLHCVRYDRNFLESKIRSAGFEILKFNYASETHGQSSYHLRKNN